MPLKRLKRKLTKEIMWLYLLKLLSEKPRYGYELKKEIQHRFNFNPAIVTSYAILYTLELKGYVTTVWKSAKKRPRKYYVITKKGRKLLLDGKKHLKVIVKKI